MALKLFIDLLVTRLKLYDPRYTIIKLLIGLLILVSYNYLGVIISHK